MLAPLASMVLAAAALTVGPGAVWAQTADRDLPLTIDAAQMKLDSKRKLRLLTGNVEVARGSFSLKAEQVELRETPQGDLAVATGTAGQLASFRQRREAFDEVVEGQAERIEYETRTEVARLIGKAVLKRWRSGSLVEEITGQTVVYDHPRETFEVQGGTGSGGRVRGVVSPAPTRPAPEPARPESGGPR
ncbi:MAG: lipopolysaccharide transport periplasmic protein LptA [Burkholderiales bacterium]